MKTFKSRKNLYTFIVAALFISFLSLQSIAQEEKKEVKIKVVKEENGKKTVIDTTINISDLENNEELKQLLQSDAFGGMDITIDDFDELTEFDMDVEHDGEGVQKKVIIMKQKDAETGEDAVEKEYIVTVIKSDSCVDGKTMKVNVDKGGTAYFFSDDGETHEIDMDGNVHKVIVKTRDEGDGEDVFISNGDLNWTEEGGRKVEVIESEDGQKVIVHNEDGTTKEYDLNEGKGAYMIDKEGNIQKVDGDVKWTADEGEMTMVTVDVEDDGEGETIWITTGNETLDLSGDKHHNVFIHSSEDIDEDAEVFVEVIVKKDGDETVRIERKIIVKDLNSQDVESLEKSGVKVSHEEADNLEIGSMKFHPNPSDGKFTLSFNVSEKGDTGISIYDINGKNVYSENLFNFEGTYKNEIDISGESKGTYFLKITQGNKMSTRKIILD